jgi:hypothetical protein
MIALAKANEKRFAVARLKASMRSGEMSLADALSDHAAQHMIVWTLLRSLPLWGEARIAKLAISLAQDGVPIGPQRRVRMLTERQKAVLVDHVISPRPERPRPAKPKARTIPKPRTVRPARIPVHTPLTVAEEDFPPRCGRCKVRLRERVPSGLCGFCVEELELAGNGRRAA